MTRVATPVSLDQRIAVSVEEAAGLVGMSPRHIQGMVQRGELELWGRRELPRESGAVRWGRVRITRRSIDELAVRARNSHPSAGES